MKIIQLILFREILCVYPENRTHIIHINILYGENADFLNLTVSGTCSYHRALNS
jgi:hypothetical protein